MSSYREHEACGAKLGIPFLGWIVLSIVTVSVFLAIPIEVIATCNPCSSSACPGCQVLTGGCYPNCSCASCNEVDLSCCENRACYDPETHECCDGSVCPIAWTCCWDDDHDSASCCNVPDGEECCDGSCCTVEQDCCDDICYDPDLEVCCRSSEEPDNPEVCTTETHRCCNGDCCPRATHCCVTNEDGDQECVLKCNDGNGPCPEDECPACPIEDGDDEDSDEDEDDNICTGGCELAEASAGRARFNVHSILARFSLGRRADGESAGRLTISAEDMQPGLATPEYLNYRGGPIPADVEVIREYGSTRQIKTPETLADVVISHDYEYEIRFYDKTSWGSKTNGLYVPSGSPFVTWVIENPDRELAHNRLLISRFVDSSCQSKYEFEFTAGTPEVWSLRSGACSGDPLREIERSKSFDQQAGTRTDTIKVYEGDDLVRQTVRVFEDFGWGYEPIEVEKGVGADTFTLYRSYYTDSQQTGKYRKVKSLTNPDGSWEMRDYDNDGRLTVKITSWKDVAMPATLNQSAARAEVRSYTSHDGNLDDGTVKPRKPRTITRTILGTVVAETYYLYYIDGNSRIVEITEECGELSVLLQSELEKPAV